MNKRTKTQNGQGFPKAAGVFLGLGMGGFFDGIVLHQVLQWHHMISQPYPPTTVHNLEANTLWDGLFHAATYIFVGIGLALLNALIEASEAHGIWTLQGVTIADNVASLALQARCGFRVVGRRERIAKRDGRWHDTILTERRSRTIGRD